MTMGHQHTREIVVGYQGGPGAFSHIAVKRHFEGRAAEHCGFRSFSEMLAAVKDGDIDFALLPIENSIAGSIHESYDLLARMDLHLVGEEVQPVAHCLIGLPDTALTEVRKVISHPVALAQCTRFLAALDDCHAEVYVDTALAVQKVKEDGVRSQAAIASDEAARIHGLPVLARNIADDPANYTRMVVVSRAPETFDLAIPCKTSLVLSLAHERGALANVLSVLAAHELNLTKIESRPIHGRPWEYLFYVDFEGNIADPRVEQAFAAIRPKTSEIRVLGCYPAKTWVSGETSA